MPHDDHESLPGYSRDQLLHAGCGECEARAGESDCGLSHLDAQRFAHAWARAGRWRGTTGNLPDLDRAEVPLLELLFAVQCQLEKFGLPLGVFPAAVLPGGWH